MPSPAYFFDLDHDALRDWVIAHDMPRHTADQLCKWVYDRLITDSQQMTDISTAHRRMLADEMTFNRLHLVDSQHATDGTLKLLLSFASQGARDPRCETECVMIPAESSESAKPRRTACISSQVGCPVGCRFCASGLGGLDANLTTGQIVEQIWWLNKQLEAQTANGKPQTVNSCHITNVVFMGMGEPLANFAAVTAAIRTLNAEWAFNIGARRITLSTVGLPAQIRRLADQLDLQITLAISLHAPSDELRRTLIPWAEFTTIDDIIDAGRYYFQTTGREVTLEYILLRHVNDRPEHARQLAKIARTLRSNVNLIRYNEVASLPYNRPDSDDVLAFQKILRDHHVNAHIRASRGRDIAAACGQLRHEHSASPSR
jgi:23S rRNA (adenine2503-C2)-methyltransferase